MYVGDKEPPYTARSAKQSAIKTMSIPQHRELYYPPTLTENGTSMQERKDALLARRETAFLRKELRKLLSSRKTL